MKKPRSQKDKLAPQTAPKVLDHERLRGVTGGTGDTTKNPLN